MGETRILSQWSETQDHETAWNLVAWLLVLMIETLACLSALAFFALRPREKEYLWFGIMMALFLSSDRALQITGVTLPFEGGVTAGDPVNHLQDIMDARVKALGA